MKYSATNQFPLLRRFSITSLVAMFVTATILVFLYRQDQLAEHKEVAAQNNEKTVMHLMRLLDDQINTLITTSNGFDTQALRANPNIDLFTAALERVREYDTLKLKIYNLSGTAIYSSARDEIGGASKHPDMLAKALSGEVVHQMEFRDTFSGATGEIHGIYISSVYVPLTHAGKRIGVIESYADATPFFKRLHATLFKIFLIALCVFAVLYAALFFYLLKTDRAISEGQKAITDSEAEFRTLAEAMPQIVWITRPDGWNIYFNQQWMDYTGLTLEESLGHGWNKPFHPDDQQRAWDAWQQATAANGIYSIESRLRRADGIYRWWLVRGVPLRDADGNILKWFGTCTDINDIKVAELEISRINLELRESEQRYRGIFENAQDIIFMFNQDGTFRAINKSFEQITGWTAAEWIGKSFAAIIHPGDLPNALDIFQKTMAGESVPPFSLRISRKSGDYFDADISVTPLGGNKVTGLVGIARDISERKQAEESLRKLSQAVEQSPSAIVITDLKANIEYVNEGFVKISGYSRAELIGQNPRLLHSGKTPRASYVDMWTHLKRGEIWKGEFINKRKDGSEYIEAVLMSPMRQPDGSVTNYLSIKNDITERKRMESELTEQLDELRRWHDATSGREDRILALKHEVNELLGKSGLPPRYPSAES
jgi:PAS domain S-box-containing protein